MDIEEQKQHVTPTTTATTEFRTTANCSRADITALDDRVLKLEGIVLMIAEKAAKEQNTHS